MRSRWTTPRALSAHVTLALCEPGFALLCWWQLHRALGGNGLSWMYVFEWPFFGVYAAVLWWRIVLDQQGFAPGRRRAAARVGPRRADRAAAAGERPARKGAGDAEREERQLAAYNRYLAALAEQDAQPRRQQPETRR